MRRQCFEAGFTDNIRVDDKNQFYLDIFFVSIGIQERLKIPNLESINFKTYVEELKKPGFSSIHIRITQSICLKKPVFAPPLN